MTVLKVEHLSKSYDHLLAVNDVSFEIADGDVFGLLGPNGAGKSTTMMILAGILKPDAGTFTIGGSTANAVNGDSRRMIGVVPQDLAVYPDLTAKENLWFFGSLYHLPKDRLKQRIDDVLDQIGLTSRGGDLVQSFSGGMKRRLNFGVALLHEPKLLILDEPTVGVDPQSRNHLLNCIKDLAARKIAVIYASHYMDEVQEVCNKVAIMDHGKILINDNLSNLLHSMNARVEITIANQDQPLPDSVKDLAEIETAESGETRLLVSPQSDDGPSEIGEHLTQVLDLLRDSGIHARAVHTHDVNLERLFLQLTGRSLRD